MASEVGNIKNLPLMFNPADSEISARKIIFEVHRQFIVDRLRDAIEFVSQGYVQDRAKR